MAEAAAPSISGPRIDPGRQLSKLALDRVADVVSSKEAISVLRIALIFGRLLTSIDPDKLNAVLSNASKETPSLLSIGKQATSKDARRGMAAAVGLLNVLGEALNAGG